jgi:hypothetical protein
MSVEAMPDRACNPFFTLHLARFLYLLAHFPWEHPKVQILIISYQHLSHQHLSQKADS